MAPKSGSTKDKKYFKAKFQLKVNFRFCKNH